jgi:hypothetical protein
MLHVRLTYPAHRAGAIYRRVILWFRVAGLERMGRRRYHRLPEKGAKT